MSAIASFYVMESKKFDEYCKLANLHKHSDSINSGAAADDVEHTPKRPKVQAVTPEMLKAADFEAQQTHYAKLFQFLRQNSTEPFQYNWSGYVFADLLGYLKEQKQIDLLSMTYQDPNCEFQYHLLNREMKDRYLAALDPVKFPEKALAFEYKEAHERARDTLLKKLTAQLGSEKVKQMMSMYQPEAEEQFPERGKAMLDGIKIVHECLKLVNGTTIVAMHVG